MKVALACDHAGFVLKSVIIEAIIEMGFVPLDLGTFSQESIDYPDIVKILGKSIQDQEA